MFEVQDVVRGSEGPAWTGRVRRIDLAGYTVDLPPWGVWANDPPAPVAIVVYTGLSLDVTGTDVTIIGAGIELARVPVTHG